MLGYVNVGVRASQYTYWPKVDKLCRSKEIGLNLAETDTLPRSVLLLFKGYCAFMCLFHSIHDVNGRLQAATLSGFVLDLILGST